MLLGIVAKMKIKNIIFNFENYNMKKKKEGGIKKQNFNTSGDRSKTNELYG